MNSHFEPEWAQQSIYEEGLKLGLVDLVVMDTRIKLKIRPLIFFVFILVSNKHA